MKKTLLAVFISIVCSESYSQQNVGIGTNNPQTKLQVAGAISSTPSSLPAAASVTIPDNVTTFRLSSVAGVQANTLAVLTPQDGQFLNIINDDDNPAMFAGFTIPAGGTSIFLYLGSDAAWKEVSNNNTGSNSFTAGTGLNWAGTTLNSMWTQSANNIYNNNSANVGIGTASPNAQLTIGPALGGTALSSTFVTNAGSLGNTSGNGLILGNFGFTSGNNSSLGIHALRTAAGSDWTTTAIGLLMDVDNTSPVNNAQIWLNSSGNVGIGTNAPTAPLDINGTIRIRGGNPAVGTVLTSDANGNGTWGPPISGGGGNFVGYVPIAGFGGEVLINSTSWQIATRTTYSNPISALFTQPVPAGYTRTYYLVIRRADNQPGGTGSYWRFSLAANWCSGNDVAGHGFSLASNWGSIDEGTTDWVQVPSNALPSTSCYYWKLDAHMANAGQSMKIFSVGMAAIDVLGGTNPAYSAASSGTATYPVIESGYDQIATNGINNNVGIGNTAPQDPLSIGAATSDGQTVNVRSYSGSPTSWKGGGAFGYSSATVILGELNGVAQIGGHNSNLTAWENLALNSGGGNVGINTTTPGYTLDLNSGTFGFGASDVRTEYRTDAGLQGNAGAQSGFFQNDGVSVTDYPAGASGWWHLIDCRHSNPSNNYAMQFANSFYDQNLYFRETNGNAAQPWSRVMTSNDINGTTNYISKFTSANTIGNSLMYDNGSGVGIGTTSPAAQFQVVGKATLSRDGQAECCSSGNYTLALSEATSVTGNQPTIQFHSSGYHEGYIRMLGNQGGQRRFQIGDNQGVGTGVEMTGPVYVDGTQNSYIMGNTGIGTSTINNLLQIQSSSSSTGLQWNTSGYIASNQWGSRAYKLDIGGGIPLKFETQYAGTWYGSVDIDHGQAQGHASLTSYYSTYLAATSGYVGINTTNPNRQLDIMSGNSDGITFGQTQDNTETIQTYIDGQWANRSTYASGCCNLLSLQPDVGQVCIGAMSATAKFEINLSNPLGWSGNLKATRIFAPDNGYYLDLNTYIVAGGNVGYQFSPNANTGMVITTPGLVGIATTNPSCQLDVAGAGLFGSSTGNNYLTEVGWYYGTENTSTPLTNGIGYCGAPANVWHYAYSYNFVNPSERQLKKHITPIAGNSALSELVMKDIDRINPSFYKYNDEADELTPGDETKYRPQMHIGVIMDEAPDYIKDAAFSGIDIYGIASLSLAGVKQNREDIKEIKNYIGMERGASISDFGVFAMTSSDTWINFSDDFINRNAGNNIPVVTVTPLNSGAGIYITEVSAKGFRIKCSSPGVTDVSVNWIAMVKTGASKINSAENMASKVPAELENQLHIPESARQSQIDLYSNLKVGKDAPKGGK